MSPAREAAAAEPLLHNTCNPVTAGIWRVRTSEGTAIRKVLSGNRPQTHPDWAVSHDPRHWAWWRREALAYEVGISDWLAPLRMPALLAIEELPHGDLALLLEDVPGRTGAALTADDLRVAMLRLGEGQGRTTLRGVPELSWLSRGFLRDHAASKHVDVSYLDEDDAFQHPLCRLWPEGLAEGLRLLHHARERLFQLAESGPRTLCHLDLWSHNLIHTPDGDTVVLDWSIVGDGALGEDLGNLVAEAALDDLVPASQMQALTETLFEAYCAGLREGGWRGDPRWARLGLTASAVKFHWLGPLHLQRAWSGEHHLYGGAIDPDPAHQYRQRGTALAVLCSWAEEALALGLALGL